MSKGCVYLVGAGPGDPGLITVRGMELISKADVVVYDNLIPRNLLEHVRPGAELMYVGKQASQHTLGQSDINKLLVEKALGGAIVVRLKGGDPFVFGRGGEEAIEIAKAGLDFEVVPGITAGIAAPAYAGIPVTHRTLASNVGLITGHETPDKADSDLDFEALAKWNGTLVFYMGVANLELICKRLMAHGLDTQTPAALVRWGTTSRQHVVTGTVQNIAGVAGEAGIKPPALIVIGQVVQLREQLNWFESRPLFGRRIVVTRARTQASSLTVKLERLGAEVIEMPTIKISEPEDNQPMLDAIAELASFDWVVFTSANAVDAFFRTLEKAGMDCRALGANRICSIGPATAARLAGCGIRPDVQPEKFLSKKIAGAIQSVETLNGKKVLCPRADIAPPNLVEDLQTAGAVVREVTAYRTEPDCSNAEKVAQLLSDNQLHWITFSSSSTVKNFFHSISPDKIRASVVHLASIGPITSQTLEQHGFSPDEEADAHTIDGLVNAILRSEETDGEEV